MTDSVYDAPAESIALGFSAAERHWIVRSELRTWATLAVASLALAGVFALMLAVSRLPGIEKIFPWVLGFFAKGLVIHVIFSLVVWFLAAFALMASIATFDSSDRKPRFAALGTTGANLVAMSFPFLLAPVFLGDSVASLNNYIPVIVHRSILLWPHTSRDRHRPTGREAARKRLTAVSRIKAPYSGNECWRGDLLRRPGMYRGGAVALVGLGTIAFLP